MHDSGFHASVVGSNFGHRSIPLSAFPRILMGEAGQLAKVETKKGWGCRANGETGVLAPGAGLGMVPCSDLGALKKDDPYDKGLCCPPESGRRDEEPVAVTHATPLITQLCHLSHREGDLETPKL